ncbi:hypothetical protein K7X08_005128 [Anisodus acutangulus]|uniref:Uncharacterized protein n=1 Tax=Anisodus acutangulus TaxID=402998 RepID=A0A9Q1MK08_9SOLA|nr:hypothetical protein K7X08_005128 [Anisodus acutangulus]
MEEVITEEEQQGEEMTNEPLFPRLEELGHFFQTKHALKFPFLRQVKTFILLGSVSTPNLKGLFVEKTIEEPIQERFNSKVALQESEHSI